VDILQGMRVGLALTVMACGGKIAPGDDGGSAEVDVAPNGGGSRGKSPEAGGVNGGRGSSGGFMFEPCPSDAPAPDTKCIAPNVQAYAYVSFGRRLSRLHLQWRGSVGDHAGRVLKLPSAAAQTRTPGR
jgi:hypothetical protein